MIKCLSNNRWYMANAVLSTEPSPCFDEIRLFHVWNNNGTGSTFMFEEQTSYYWASNMMFPSCLANVPSNGTWQLSVGGCCWFSDTIFGFKFQSSGDYPTILPLHLWLAKAPRLHDKYLKSAHGRTTGGFFLKKSNQIYIYIKKQNI